MRWQHEPGINNDVITSQAEGDIRMLLPAYFREKKLCHGCRHSLSLILSSIQQAVRSECYCCIWMVEKHRDTISVPLCYTNCDCSCVSSWKSLSDVGLTFCLEVRVIHAEASQTDHHHQAHRDILNFLYCIPEWAGHREVIFYHCCPY